tara:strand:- start:674 stop:1525 length:852 start_codon:yes stop_codon:yes gene_type:complete
MSHVWGQGSIASNHYRTSGYRAEQFAAPVVETFASNERRALKALVPEDLDVAKRGLKNALPDLRRQLDADLIDNDNIKRLLDSSDDDILKRLDNLLTNPDNADESFDWLRVLLDPTENIADNKTARNAMSRSLRGSKADDFVEVTADLTQDTMKAGRRNADDIIEQADVSPFTKRAMTTGAIVGTSLGGLAIIMGMGGNEAIQKWVDNTTGLNCGQKAEDQGLDPSTPEYAAAVQDCQEGVADNLMKLGYGALAIIGFVGLVAVARAIPKRKAPEEEEEEEGE